MLIPMNDILPNPEQPRTIFDKEELEGLAMIETKLPTNLKTAARATCKACELYKEASLVICRRCPLPEFLKRIEPGE